jgi:cellulose synthase/poly-beta-1,6-N-acetylglucosamine synthase-like glycosyltransferase
MDKIVFLFSLIALFRSLRALSKVWVSKKFLQTRNLQIEVPKENKNFYIVIPVLREQNIIHETLDYYLGIYQANYENIKLDVVVTGTGKEVIEKETNKQYLADIFNMCIEGTSKAKLKKAFVGILSDYTIDSMLEFGKEITPSIILDLFNSQASSADVFNQWIEEKESILKRENHISYRYLECPELNGNRTSQINYAFDVLRREMKENDIFVIYDADSHPQEYSFYDVASRELECGQQPLHYLDAANRLAHERKDPVVVANALYQSCWTIIKEIPNFMGYMRHIEHLKKENNNNHVQYKNSVYMFGHGEFMTVGFLDKIQGLPKDVITDGMQLGYRLSLINQPVQLLSTFCSDDVPNTVPSLITQHSRWFAGNVQYGSAYRWARDFLKIKLPTKSYLENILLNTNWALRPFLFFGLVVFTYIFVHDITLKSISYMALLSSLIVYSYITPYFALKLMPVKPDVRFIDWLSIPLAILIKSIGPWKYMVDIVAGKLLGFDPTLKKVER